MAPCRSVILEKLIVFKHFMETEGLSLRLQEIATSSYPGLDQSISCPHPITWRPILILSSHLRLGIPSVFSLRPLHRSHVCMFSLSHSCYMLCTSHFSWLDLQGCIFRFVRRCVSTVVAPRWTPKVEDHSRTELIIYN
jgi:hypothetical protein